MGTEIKKDYKVQSSCKNLIGKYVLSESKSCTTIEFQSMQYLKNNNLDKFKVFVPKANGSGKLGEIISTPLIGEPNTSATQHLFLLEVLIQKMKLIL